MKKIVLIILIIVALLVAIYKWILSDDDNEEQQKVEKTETATSEKETVEPETNAEEVKNGNDTVNETITNN